MKFGLTALRGSPIRVWLVASVLGWAVGTASISQCAEVALTEPPPVNVPDGFEVQEFAGDDLAHDIFCMTLDSQGRVAVAGPGYVRFLIDDDKNGRADRAVEFSDSPKNGAQGMFFHGRSLLAIGDGGLLRFRDRDGNDVADGAPDLLVKFKTGGEHDTHSIQQGPDGWWYVIAGNTSEVQASYASLPTSPVKSPRAGVVLRFKPDLSGGEIIADGLRNAYDFTFNAQGDLFTYDSDDERDISLPWYRPTRVFHVLPGTDHGWVSRSWKRPNYFFDMPPVVGSFGRGSPTGLTCYRHRQFPESYQNAVFALDWTYGRVLCLKLQPSGSTWTAQSEVFMSGRGGIGFAPTDCEVAPDGSLLVSVGGRGTRGAVYRVRAKDRPAPLPVDEPGIEQVLTAPQPLASWSRSFWRTAAKDVPRGEFLQAALDRKRPVDQRVRALEVITELHGGLTVDEVRAFSTEPVAEVRARSIWSYGRTAGGQMDVPAVSIYLADTDPRVARAALEAGQALAATSNWSPAIKPLAELLGREDRYNRLLAAMLVSKMPEESLGQISQAATEHSARAVVSYAAGWLAGIGQDTSRIRKAMSPVAVAVIKGEYPPDLKLDALRLIEWMLGDLGPSERHPAAFDGYAPGIDPQELERDWDALRIELADVYPTGLTVVDVELSRVLAMLSPVNQKLLDRVLAFLTPESNPVDDIHQLLVAARLPVPRTTEQRLKIGEALVRLDEKFTARKLPQDSAWNDRMTDLYKALAGLDEFLATSLVEIPGFGRPGHVLYMSEMPPHRLEAAINAFASRIAESADYGWTNDVVFLMGASSNPTHRQLVRDQADRYEVRSAVLMTLAESPVADDRSLFLEGLESSQAEVVQACLTALDKLGPSDAPSEQIALLKTVRRLGQDEREYAARETAIKLLERNTGHREPFVFGKEGYKPQTPVIAAWTQWCTQKWPGETQQLLGGNDADVNQMRQIMAGVDWSTGDVARGAKLYQTRSCASCHGGRSALGPDLQGVTGRFSRDDLFTAIVQPSRDVSARYQTTLIQTSSGQTLAGLIVYESVDGLLLRNATHQTFRVETRDIEERRKSPVSLMPAGLLKDLSGRDYADLYAYLASLGEKTKTSAAPSNAGE